MSSINDWQDAPKIWGAMIENENCKTYFKYIYSDGELDLFSTCAENVQVQFEGKRQVKRHIKIYNLDLIISVGYRVKSQRGIVFIRWAKST